jgi:hypothetical protein
LGNSDICHASRIWHKKKRPVVLALFYLKKEVCYFLAQHPAFFSFEQDFISSFEQDFSVLDFSFFLGVSCALAGIENKKAAIAIIEIAFFMGLV